MINLNRATPAELVAQAGVTAAQAYDLNLWAPYTDWEDVLLTPGIDAATVAKLQAAQAILGERSSAA